MVYDPHEKGRLTIKKLDCQPVFFIVVLDGGKQGSAGGGEGSAGFSKMVKKMKGRAAISAAGALVQKLKTDKGFGGKGDGSSKKVMILHITK